MMRQSEAAAIFFIFGNNLLIPSAGNEPFN